MSSAQSQLDQANRILNLATPLGENVLLLTSFRGTEGMSQLFRFHLEMISDDNAISPRDVVGQKVSFSICLADGTPRYFDGCVSRFVAGDEDENGRRNYYAELVPWFWFLTRASDCRIFQEKTVPQIVEQVFSDLGFSDYSLKASRKHPVREYCVQYRESDFQFVSRLLQQEGLFYYFEHDNGKHLMVIADEKTAYANCVESEVDYPRDAGSRAMEDHITHWQHVYEFRTGRFSQTDYDFQTPSKDLATRSKTVVDLPRAAEFEFYDYPGKYTSTRDGRALTDVRMEREEVGWDTVDGASLCKTFSTGATFSVRKHRSDTEEGKAYVLTEVRHEATEPMAYETGSHVRAEYRNTFRCIPASVNFRPPVDVSKPFVRGVQTAVVVGPSGEEIFPDEHGRVKVQFHWDREGRYDEHSSCWVRVSQVHAGKGFGGMDIPRIGEEVIVVFEEGDPDRPIIVGRLYHAENTPPFALPSDKNVSGLTSRSTPGGGGYNEISMNDTKGKEGMTLHAQKDMSTTVENDLTLVVHNNRTATIDVDDSESVGSNQSVSIGASQDTTVGANQDVTVGANQTTGVGADRNVSVGANQNLTVGASRAVSIAASDTLTVGGSIEVGASGAITITSAASITLVVGGSAIEIGPGGITLSSAGLITETAGLVKHNA